MDYTASRSIDGYSEPYEDSSTTTSDIETSNNIVLSDAPMDDPEICIMSSDGNSAAIRLDNTTFTAKSIATIDHLTNLRHQVTILENYAMSLERKIKNFQSQSKRMNDLEKEVAQLRDVIQSFQTM